MLRLCLILGCLALAQADDVPSQPEPSPPKLWAVLVAGSNSWYNYRHQADICHAYQIMHKHGIPDEQIVVMMYDDIAQAEDNPTPGIVINRPNGPDVYKGVLHDYTGETVTPQNFLNVLQGNAAAMQGIGSGKVINSGPNDHVFVNLVDHGATGIFAFPSDELTVKDLNDAINNMYEQKKYAKMVIYMEACESGSMFKGILQPNINVYATTAADYNESSYACYFDDKRQTYLGDWYSVNWMEDTDGENIEVETLLKQFQITQKETNTSHVMEYGDLSISKLSVGEFQGEKEATPVTYPKVKYDAVPGPQAYLDILYKRLSYSNNETLKQELLKELKHTFVKRQFVDGLMKHLVHSVSQDPQQEKRIWQMRRQITNLDCHDALVKAFSRTCLNLGKNSYVLKYMYTLVNMCEEKLSPDDVVSLMQSICARNFVESVH